jgi:hypothetical protein
VSLDLQQPFISELIILICCKKRQKQPILPHEFQNHQKPNHMERLEGAKAINSLWRQTSRGIIDRIEVLF